MVAKIVNSLKEQASVWKPMSLCTDPWRALIMLTMICDNHHHRLKETRDHQKETSQSVSLREFSKKFNWRKSCLDCGRHHSMGLGSQTKLKARRKPTERQHSSLSAHCLQTWYELSPQVPTATPSWPWWTAPSQTMCKINPSPHLLLSSILPQQVKKYRKPAEKQDYGCDCFMTASWYGL